MIFKKLLASTTGFLTAMMLMTSFAFAEINIVTAKSVNVRSSSNTEARVVGQLNTNDRVNVVDAIDGWRKIQFNSGYGWVYAKFLKPSPEVSRSGSAVAGAGSVIVTGNSVNLRSGPTTEYAVIDCFNKGTTLHLISKKGNWINVKTSSGKTGWVLSSLVSIRGSSSENVQQQTQNKSNRGASSSRGEEGRGSRQESLRSSLVARAREYLGVNYVYGGNTPSGFDCSGYVKYIFAKYGVTLDRVAAEQALNGRWVSKGALRAGDLVFFDTNGGKNYINHVGIYIGNGRFIHASSGSDSVITSDLSEGFYSSHYITGRNVID